METEQQRIRRLAQQLIDETVERLNRQEVTPPWWTEVDAIALLAVLAGCSLIVLMALVPSWFTN